MSLQDINFDTNQLSFDLPTGTSSTTAVNNNSRSSMVTPNDRKGKKKIL